MGKSRAYITLPLNLDGEAVSQLSAHARDAGLPVEVVASAVLSSQVEDLKMSAAAAVDATAAADTADYRSTV